ncbi:flagellar hook capping FlgD N-terminal domain-containing protein [Comamonas sp. Y6]|uniref:Basal-body rod modification protein FlgD n=1 Tax=Comamonas resistens TaxID=3046670 RepID=A0ABY8STY6_9BURK|nr:flagellar hook capping FlgD N-terminal domain-containing protein [Comamonas resistens]MDL5038646.1 flagellar hook capping FlgD N-terminal domain-containing protein [Comamonas resistens]WHS65986.1 flagellar hook capping FlgD N-terminal domain-containing protein [Comamonas resistens]
MIYGTDSTGATGTNVSSVSKSKSEVTNPQEAQDRFLKLLVAQLQSQDPMNPMDNAQMTSQMAQINTVTGIQQLNQTMQSMAGQFTAMQVLQGTSMIGRTVLTEGNTLGVAADGTHTAAFDLEGSAASVKVSITTASGELVDTIDLGSGQEGRNYFTWNPAGKYSGDASQLRYTVTAANAGAAVAATTLSPHAVIATSANNGNLTLELDNGSSLAYAEVKAVY